MNNLIIIYFSRLSSRRLLRITILVFVFIAPQYESLGQDIQKAIGDVGTRLKRDPVKVYGAVDLLGQLYQSKNQTAYYPDLTYRAFAQLQFDIAGIQAPFSFCILMAIPSIIYRLIHLQASVLPINGARYIWVTESGAVSLHLERAPV